MPSPDIFRFRADSRILPLQGSFANGSLANAYQLAAQGKSELKCASENICNKCKGQLHDETDCPKQPDEHEEEEPEHDSELDAFESGVIGALDTRGAMKKPAAKARAAAALAPMKAMKTAMKTMKLIKLKKVKPMKAMTAMKTMKKLMKKPSSTKKDVPGWSLERRMKNYPTSCSKCRNSPACTYSCFKCRGQITSTA